MRWLGPHWTLDGLARELHRRAEAWVYMGQDGDRKRLDGEFLGHDITRSVVSFARYYVMMQAQDRMAPRRLKILAIRFVDPESNKQVDVDWEQAVRLVNAVLGEDVLYSWSRMEQATSGINAEKKLTYQWVTFYDHNWKAIEFPEVAYIEGATRWIEHEHYPYKVTASLDLINKILEEEVIHEPQD